MLAENSRPQPPLLQGTAVAFLGFCLNPLGNNLPTAMNFSSSPHCLFVIWSRFKFLGENDHWLKTKCPCSDCQRWGTSGYGSSPFPEWKGGHASHRDSGGMPPNRKKGLIWSNQGSTAVCHSCVELKQDMCSHKAVCFSTFRASGMA